MSTVVVVQHEYSKYHVSMWILIRSKTRWRKSMTMKCY